jgi:hypothetical protein
MNQGVLNNSFFDASIRIEEIVDHLKARIRSEFSGSQAVEIELKARLESKVELLEILAGKRARGDWSPNPVAERVDFMSLYWRLAADVAPGLKATSSTGSRQSTTILFTGLHTPGVNCSNIRHDFGKKHYVTLVIPRAATSRGTLAASGLLPKGALLDAAPSGNLLVRLAAKPIVPSADRFERQREIIKENVRRVLELEAWARTHATDLSKIFRQR